MRKAYRPIKVWRSRFNYELYYVYNELEVVKVMRARRARKLGNMCNILEQETCRKFIFYKPQGNRRLGRPAVR